MMFGYVGRSSCIMSSTIIVPLVRCEFRIRVIIIIVSLQQNDCTLTQNMFHGYQWPSQLEAYANYIIIFVPTREFYGAINM